MPADLSRRTFRFAVPGAAFTVAMVAFPFAYTIWMSLQAYSFGGAARFSGLANYGALAADPEFWNGLRVTLVIYVACLALQLTLGTYLGVLLHHSRRMGPILRSTLISPFVLPPVVVGMMWLVILDPSLGAANYILESLGLPKSLWLASPHVVIPTIVLIDTWQWTPYVALIVLGGLQSIPPSVYEAAACDGAPASRTFFRITLPLLGPTLVTAAILRSVDLLRFFDIIYITTQGGPGNASNALNIYAFRKAFEFFDLGYASALMITLSTIVLGAVLVLLRARRAVSW